MDLLKINRTHLAEEMSRLESRLFNARTNLHVHQNKSLSSLIDKILAAGSMETKRRKIAALFLTFEKR